MLQILFLISTIYIIFYIVLILCESLNIKSLFLSKSTTFFVLFSLSLAVVGCSINPTTDAYDLYRHYLYIDSIRNMNYSFCDFMFNPQNPFGGYSKSSLYGFKLLVYIVSKLNNNRFLPFFSIFIVYSIWGYITINWLNLQKKSTFLFPSFLLCSSLMPYIYVNTGIRNSLAASIVALALYQDFIERKKILYVLSVLIFACTIHHAVSLAIPCWILAHYRFNFKMIFIIFALIISVNPIMLLFHEYSSGILYTISSSYLIYIGKDAYFYSYTYLILDTFFLVTIFSILLFARKHNIENIDCMYNFILIYLAILMGQVGNYDLVLRPMYIIAMFSGIIICYLVNFTKKLEYRVAIYIMSIVFFFAAFLVYIPNYITISYF